MKKHNLILLISATALMASCSGTPATSGSTAQSSEPESSVNSVESNVSTSESGWTSEQEAIMKEHLGGLVLPYYEGDNLELVYDSDYDCVSITFDYFDDVFDTMVDLYNANNFDAYSYTFFYEIFNADIYDNAWNNVNVQGYAYYESETDTDPSGFELDAYYTESVSDWPADEIASYVSYLGSSVVVPEFTSEAYLTSANDEYYTIICLGGVNGTEGETSYKETFEAAGWTIDDSYYDYYGYFATSPDGKVEVQFYADGTPLYVYISAASSDDSGDDSGDSSYEGFEDSTFEGFPADNIAEWLSAIGATATSIPEFDYNGTWYSDTSYLGYDIMTWYFEDSSLSTTTTEDVYKAALESEGYTIDDSEYEEYGYFADPADDNFYIQFYYYSDCFVISVCKYSDSEDEDPEVEVVNGYFDFSTEDQITDQGTESATWEAGDFTFTLEKNSSSVNVGNGTFYAAPLRIYSGQKGTISWDDSYDVSSIIFTVNLDNSKSAVENLTNGTITGATVSAEENVVTMVPEEGVTSVTFVTTGKQVHLDSIEVVFDE